MLEDKDEETIEQLRLDSSKVCDFRKELFKRVKSGLTDSEFTYQNAIIHAEALLSEDNYKDVKSLKSLKFTELWWKKFKDFVNEKIPRVDRMVSEDESGNKDEDDDLVVVGTTEGSSNLSQDQQYQIYQFKKENPDWSFLDVSRHFSETFKDAIKI